MNNPLGLDVKLMAALEAEKSKALNERKLKGKYKIQIWFRSDRSSNKPIAFSLSAWQSGMRLHGGGDEMMFLCKKLPTSKNVMPSELKFRTPTEHTVEPKLRGCGLFIPGENSVDGRIICPHCGTNHNSEDVGDAVFYRLTVDKAVKVLVDWYHKLESCADIYAKYTPLDPRTIMMAKSYDPKTAREKKGLTIYPWKNILEDTSNGSTLESRFKAFILA